MKQILDNYERRCTDRRIINDALLISMGAATAQNGVLSLGPNQPELIDLLEDKSYTPLYMVDLPLIPTPFDVQLDPELQELPIQESPHKSIRAILQRGGIHTVRDFFVAGKVYTGNLPQIGPHSLAKSKRR